MVELDWEFFLFFVTRSIYVLVGPQEKDSALGFYCTRDERREHQFGIRRLTAL